MRVRTPFRFAVLVTLAIAGCGGDGNGGGASQAASGTIAGVVTDSATGAPIAGAGVSTTPAAGSATANATGAFTITGVPAGVYEVEAAATGYESQSVANVTVTAGQTTSVQLQLSQGAATASVTGRVLDAADFPVPTAAVVLIDAGQVAASGLEVEEPLATLEPTSPYRVATGTDGTFALSGVMPGSYYLYVVPSDDIRLPGGSRSRAATAIAVGHNDLGTILLSHTPSPAATYVGSTSCLTGCHAEGIAPDKHGYIQTLHAMTYRVPGVYTANMDPSLYPRRDRALGYFFDGNPDDNSGENDGYGYLLDRLSNDYNVLLGNDGRYFAVFRSKDGAILSERYYVDFTFGGEGIWKQRFVTRIAGQHYVGPGTGSYYILPIQFDERAQEGLGVKPWVGYNAANWGAPTTDGGATKSPAQAKSFDLNCAGCHFTGTALTVDAAGDYRADAVDDPNGALDYDGDGTLDEIVQGCEMCHGPGSEHIASPGKRIIQPGLLAAERASMICGQCHVRGEGKGKVGGAHTEYPSRGTDALIEFPRAGVTRAEFVAQFHTDKPGQWPDERKHAKQHHQQYHDHIRSRHYRNGAYLLACDSCHDSHDASRPRNVIGSVEDNSACMTCHATAAPFSLPPAPASETVAVAVESHMVEYAGMATLYDPANRLGLINYSALGYSDTPFLGGPGNCVSCHMPRTSKSAGLWIKEGGSSGTIVLADITSHQFGVVTPAVSANLKLKGEADIIPNSCGACHNALTGTFPDLVP